MKFIGNWPGAASRLEVARGKYLNDSILIGFCALCKGDSLIRNSTAANG